MPAHASFGWDWGDEAEGERERNMVVCQQREWADGNWSLAAEPPSGQLNPINDRVYEVSFSLHSIALALTIFKGMILLFMSYSPTIQCQFFPSFRTIKIKKLLNEMAVIAEEVKKCNTLHGFIAQKNDFFL